MDTPEFKLFDAHFHIIDPRFPLVPNAGYVPGRYTSSDYLERIQAYRPEGGAIVTFSESAYGALMGVARRVSPLAAQLRPSLAPAIAQRRTAVSSMSATGAPLAAIAAPSSAHLRSTAPLFN